MRRKGTPRDWSFWRIEGGGARGTMLIKGLSMIPGWRLDSIYHKYQVRI